MQAPAISGERDGPLRLLRPGHGAPPPASGHLFPQGGGPARPARRGGARRHLRLHHIPLPLHELFRLPPRRDHLLRESARKLCRGRSVGTALTF